MIETVDRKLARATSPGAETEARAYESAAAPSARSISPKDTPKQAVLAL